MKKQIGTIDLTPTWSEALNIYLFALESGSARARAEALTGLRHMANLAQLYAEIVQAGELRQTTPRHADYRPGQVWEYIGPSPKKAGKQIILALCTAKIIQFIAIDGERNEQITTGWFGRYYKQVGAII